MPNVDLVRVAIILITVALLGGVLVGVGTNGGTLVTNGLAKLMSDNHASYGFPKYVAAWAFSTFLVMDSVNLGTSLTVLFGTLLTAAVLIGAFRVWKMVV